MIQIVRLQATEAVLDERRMPERDFVFCDPPSYEDQNAQKCSDEDRRGGPEGDRGMTAGLD